MICCLIFRIMIFGTLLYLLHAHTLALKHNSQKHPFILLKQVMSLVRRRWGHSTKSWWCGDCCNVRQRTGLNIINFFLFFPPHSQLKRMKQIRKANIKWMSSTLNANDFQILKWEDTYVFFKPSGPFCLPMLSNI